MNSLKKIKIKLTAIILIFMLVLFSVNIQFLYYDFDQNLKYTSRIQSNELVDELKVIIDGIKTTTKEVAKNEIVIDILDSNSKYEDLESEEIEKVQSEINMAEGLLNKFDYINNIKIASISGKYLFNNNKISKNFDLKKRPWFKDEYFNIQDKIITSSIHNDFDTGKQTISIATVIYSPKDGRAIGIAIVDILVDNLLSEIDSGFYLGNLKTFIKIDNGAYYSSNEVITDIESIKKDEYYIKLDEGLDILFRFDKKSSIYYKSFYNILEKQIFFYLFFGVLLTLALLLMTERIFKPIGRGLEKFKHLFKNLEEKDFELDGKDEFKELEIISNALSKSFDSRINKHIFYDDLTNLPNRKKLVNITDELIIKNKEFALLFIDLNKFKEVNDLLGHLAGDTLLREFSNIMKNTIKDKGIITRYSGDEFIIIYTDYKGEEELKEFYENNMLEAFKTPIQIDGKSIKVSFSVGVAIYPKDGDHVDELIKKSDFMMYKNKGNKALEELLFFHEDFYKSIKKIEDIKLNLRSALKNNEFELYYQPVMDSKGNVCKLESLIRWKSKNYGTLSPLDFIKYAEETGDIIFIGYWVIQEVCIKYREICNNYKKGLQISINISPIQLMEKNFASNIEMIIKKYEIDFNLICLEVTELAFLENNYIVIDNLEKIRNLGIHTALDDFGSGYASFSYLKRFKFNILKIDKLFIDKATNEDYKIIKSIKEIADVLNMKVIIEGVETLEQYNALKEINCDFFQGYYFAKPLNIEEIKNFLLVANKNKSL
ncbi:hypothetical protein JCM1393_05760 [Clostridium carnis]